MITNVRYYWVRFYIQGQWQLVKFWTQDGKDYLKGLDWGSPHKVDKFDNRDYQIGPELFPPES